MTRGWIRRAASLAALAVIAYVVLRMVERDPEPVRLTALCLLLALAVWTVVDLGSSTQPHPGFHVSAPGAASNHGVDPRTDALARLVEGHLQARRPDGQLNARLVDLAQQRLAQRHGVRLHEQPEQARALLGDATFAHLVRPPRRYSPAEIESTLSRIEEL